MIFDIKLTSACNSKCLNCSIWTSKVKHINSYRVLDIITQFKDSEFIFSGGECLLHPDIFGIIKFSARNNVNFLILSNGTDYNKIERAIECGAKRITLSVDGYDHDKLRGVKGNLDTIRMIIKHLSKKADIRLAYTISNSNSLKNDIWLLEELIALGANKSVYFVIMQKVKSFNVDEESDNDAIAIPNNLNKFHCMSSTTKKYLSAYPNPISICHSPEFYISIYEDGNVRFCQAQMYDFILGNINEVKLLEILKKSNWIRKQSNKCAYKNKCWIGCHRRWDIKTNKELQLIKRM